MRNKSYYDRKRRTADRRCQQRQINQRNRRPRRHSVSPFWIIFVVVIVLLTIIVAGIFLKLHKNQRTDDVIEDVILEEDSTLEENIYYYHAELSTEDRMLYDIILKGVCNCDTSIFVNTTDTDRIFNIVNLMMADHPELF